MAGRKEADSKDSSLHQPLAQSLVRTLPPGAGIAREPDHALAATALRRLY